MQSSWFSDDIAASFLHVCPVTNVAPLQEFTGEGSNADRCDVRHHDDALTGPDRGRQRIGPESGDFGAFDGRHIFVMIDQDVVVGCP